MTTNQKMNPNKIARIAGLLYVFPWVLSLFAVFLRQGLIVPGDAAMTASNIEASESLFRLSIVSDLVVQVIFIRIFGQLVIFEEFKFTSFQIFNPIDLCLHSYHCF